MAKNQKSEWLKLAVLNGTEMPFQDGDVIRWVHDHGGPVGVRDGGVYGRAKQYMYAALYAGGKWYNTSTLFGPLSTADLLAKLANSRVSDVRIASKWSKVDL